MDYLDSTSNKEVVSLHEKIVRRTGLVKIQDAKDDLLDLFPKESIGKLSYFETTLLVAIYSSQIRGVTLEEINNYSKAFPKEDVVKVLNSLEQKLLIYAREDKEISYHGFQDLLSLIFKKVIKKTKDKALGDSVQWQNYSHYLVPHLITILSNLRRKKVRITNDNKIHLKNVKHILSQMTVQENVLFSSLPDEEFQFLVSFLNDSGCFFEREGILIFSEKIDELLENKIVLLNRFFSWWRSNKLLGQTTWLEKCIKLKEEWNVAELSHMIVSYEGPISRKIKFGTLYLDYIEKGLDWSSLPRMIKELWILGGLNFCIQEGIVKSIQWDHKVISMILGIKEVKVESESEMIFLPNFEILMDHHSNPLLRYQVELIADKMNNDIMSRYRISKETIQIGLQHVFSSNSFLELVDKLKFNEEQIKIIKNWASNFLCACFEEISVLRLTNMEKWKGLKTISAFNAFVEEEIPNFGIIFKRKNKEELHSLLRHLGIFPKDGNSSQEFVLKPFNFFSEYCYKTESFHSDPIVFSPDLTYLNNTSLGRVKNKSKLPNFEEKLNLIKDAIQEKKDLEISFLDKKMRVCVNPLCIMKNEHMIGTNIKTGCREQFVIYEMTSLRIIS